MISEFPNSEQSRFVENFAFEKLNSVSGLPKDILNWEGKFTNTFDNLSDVEQSYIIRHGDGSETYVLERRGIPQEDLISRRIFFIDYIDGKRVGFTEIDCSTTRERDNEGKEIASSQPDVVKTFTTEEGDLKVRGQGLGTRRLKIANQYCVTRLGKALHSGMVTSDIGHGPWRRLLQEGLAEETGRTNDTNKFRFKLQQV